jgi:VCBS repeat-containing protein
VTINGDGTLNYTPNADYNGADTISYTVQDNGASNGAPDPKTGTATVAVTVTAVNDAPVAAPDSATVNKAGLAFIDVLANDTDAENDALTAVLASDPVHGTVLLDEGGVFTYIHDGGDTLSDSFTYQANDGTADGNTVTVQITVTANDPPVAVADSAIVTEGGQVVINVLANDTDAENDPLTTFNVSKPAHGTVTPGANGTLIYLHDGSDTLSDSFTYQANDGTQVGDAATVTITVTPVDDTPVNTAPVPKPDSATAFEDGAPVVIDVLANDTDADVGDTKRVVSVNGTTLQGSQVIIAADGLSVSYNILKAFQFLTTGETDLDTFSYTMEDSKGAQSTAQVTVTVIGVNDAPVAVADFESTRVNEDSGPVRIDVLRNDPDPDGNPFGNDTLTVLSVDAASALGSVTIIENGGAVEYSVGNAFQALSAGQSATDIFFYTIEDGSGLRSTAKVEVTVIGRDEPPPPGSILGTANNDTFNAASTPPTTNGNDTVFGLFGDDVISSLGGADTLYGGPDRDDLDAGAGNDILTGNADRDTLAGGAGADIFVFETLLDSETLDPDRVQDFSSAEGDGIDLRLIDADVFAAGNNAFTLIAGTTFTRDVPGQLFFDPATNLLQGDVNGDAAADFAIFLVGVASVSATDFLL